jgi:hypothetical protein
VRLEEEAREAMMHTQNFLEASKFMALKDLMVVQVTDMRVAAEVVPVAQEKTLR